MSRATRASAAHWLARTRGGNPIRPDSLRAVLVRHLEELLQEELDLATAWRAEAAEREARAANPEVVGVVERLTEEAVVRTLRRCAAAIVGAD